jgi:hypothetical protein
LYIILAFNSTVYAKTSYKSKIIFGRREEVLMFEEKIKYKAKLDTGAKSASLLALNIQEFEIDGKLWVSFQVINPKTGAFINKEFPLKRYASIKQRRDGDNKVSKCIKRPVIILPICLGNTVRVIEINLVDRRHFVCPVLLGRDAIIQFNAIVDPNKMYTTFPRCKDLS